MRGVYLICNGDLGRGEMLEVDMCVLSVDICFESLGSMEGMKI